ncbi:MAG: Crp/Fnr family transcriptional regulator [Hyphomicrobiaceae bacterium]|nr:Crp/Fnr family transcriptional regulator [Hyphomicrobiaceae bacterium]
MREYSIGAPLGLEPVIPADLIEKLVDAGLKKTFRKNAAIYRQGDTADHVYVLLSGRAKTVLVAPGGQQALLRIHLPHNVLGLTALASTPARDGDAVAIEPIETAMVSREQLRKLMRDEPRLAEHLLELMVNRMCDFHYRVGEMMTQSVDQRLARALLALSEPDPTASDENERAGITLTHEELANLLNTRRPTISAAINRFAGAGLIRKSGRRLHVLDPSGLRALFQAAGA